MIVSNHPAFEHAAIETILGWRFELGRLRGEPHPVRARQQLIFLLDPKHSAAEPFVAPPRASDRVPEAFRYDQRPLADLIVAPVFPRDLAVAEFNSNPPDHLSPRGESRLLGALRKDGGGTLPSLAELDVVPKALFRARPA